ncbi:MAG TPA: histidine kinase [Micromonosporaceae bacterium]|jgi:signal transduction histidine kinase
MAVSRIVTYAVAAFTVVSVAAAVALLVTSPDRGEAIELASLGTIAVFNAGCGLVVAVKRPRLWIGALLALVGFIVAQQGFNAVYDGVHTRRPDLVSGSGSWDLTLSQGAWMVLFLPAAFLLLFFPDGRLPARSFRWVVVGLVAVPVVFDLAAAFDTTPFPAPYARVPHALPTLHGLARTVIGVGSIALLPLFLALLIGSAAAMVVRYRRATDPSIRAQVRWFALGAMTLPATLVVGWATYLLIGGSDVVVVGLAIAAFAIPAATVIAMLRHDLYDIDKAISFTITYGAVTVALLAVYTGISFLGGLAVGRDSAIAAAAATAVCAVLLAPLRRRLQRGVDRRLYPARQAALAAIDDLRTRTHLGIAEPEQLESALRVALRDERLRVGYLLPGEDGFVDAAGRPLDASGQVVAPIRVGEHDIGALIRGEIGSRELLRELAAASVLLVEVVRLRIHLGQALRDVEESRSRLLAAGYEERRKLERDLHDGAQQRLVSLGMGLRLAQRHLGTVDVDGLLDEAVAELGTAVAELRQIAGGLRPSSLDDGLAAALANLAGRVPVPVTLEVCPDLLPDDLATTAYYVVSEALTNAVKHARAEAIVLTVTRTDGHINVCVRDDGAGGATVRPGAGLAGLSDRVAAAGGALRVNSRRGHGTLIEAMLPCG